MKDLFDTAGLTTTYGSVIYADHVPERQRRGGDAARGGRVRERRQDEPARVRVRDHVREPALRDGAEPARIQGAWPAGRAAARRRRSRPGSPTSRSARTPAARSGSRRPAAGSSASSRRYGLVLARRRASRSRRASTTPGRWQRSVGECEEMLQALADGFEPAAARLAGGARGRRRLARPARIPRARASPRGGGAVPAAARDRLPLAERIGPVFMREVADVHRDLFAEFADSYGDNVRHEDRALPGADRRRVRRPGCTPRAELAERAEEALGRPRPRPDADARVRRAEAARSTTSRSARDTIRPHDPVQLARLARTRACRAAPAEDGLPASLQIAGRPGSDALVLAAGKLVESLLQHRDAGRASRRVNRHRSALDPPAALRRPRETREPDQLGASLPAMTYSSTSHSAAVCWREPRGRGFLRDRLSA